jgi:hypothetical protein
MYPAILCALLLGISAASLAEGLRKNAGIERMVDEISAGRIETTIRKRVGFETRNSLSETGSDTRGAGAARRWIKREVERGGSENGGRLKVEFDEHLAPVNMTNFPKPFRSP